MCNVTTCSLILDVLNKAISNKEVFTAYDITLRARNETTDAVPHCDVRDIVRNEFGTGEMEGYGRDLCELTSPGSPQAFVYFPDGKKSSDHLFVEDVVAPVDDDDDTEDEESETVGITSDCRIDIPKKILAKVSATAGGSYDIRVNGTFYCRRPARDGRVRIGLKRLGGLATFGKCSVSADSMTDIITVTFV